MVLYYNCKILHIISAKYGDRFDNSSNIRTILIYGIDREITKRLFRLFDLLNHCNQ